MTFAFIIATCWATVGCLITRALQRASFSRLTVFWAMSVFAFTFANELALFPLFGQPIALFVGAVASVAVVAANHWFEDADPRAEAAPWEKPLFAGTLVAAGTASSFNSGSAIRQYTKFAGATTFPVLAGPAILAGAMFPALVGAVLLVRCVRARDQGRSRAA